MVGYIENFLTTDEIEWFRWYWSQLPTKIDTGQRMRSFAHYDREFFHRIREKLSSKIQPNEEITTVNLYQDYAPGGIHSDGWIDFDKNDKMGTTYLVPIQMSEDFQTIIFQPSSDEAVSLNAELGLGNSGLVTYKQVTRDYFDLSDEPFDKEMYDKYLTHLDYNMLRGLRVIQVQEWKLGRAMIWPRSQLHCSANFNKGAVRDTLLIATKLC